MSPALVLTLVLVLGSAALFHAACGQTMRGLGVAGVAALVGFLVGEALARGLGADRWLVGQVHVLPGLVGAWLAMAVAWQRRAWR